ncbi:MAG: acyl-CoA dehydrogenase family protein, partial [Candidatus Hydrothermae bacterium]|nr:acyl-CoA dehydrogenase family protein [Candidatus Hydrothermae bacterium]
MSDKPLYKRGGGFLLESTPLDQTFTPEDFNEEQKMIAQMAREFMEKEVFPHRDKLESHDYDLLRSLMKKAGELGLLSADVPPEYEGMGLDKASSMLIAENLSGEGSFAVTWGAHTGIGTLPIVFFGTEEQKKTYLPKLASGEWIGAYALTEPGAGSDAMNIKTRAERDGDHWVLSGQKQFITNAGFADLFVVFAKVDGEAFTAFLVERDTPGLTIGPEERKMGIKGSSTCPLYLDKVRIPANAVLGEIGKGHRIAFGILNIGRYKLGVAALGAAKYALKEAQQYARERVQFGRPIAEFPLIQQKLGEMAWK